MERLATLLGDSVKVHLSIRLLELKFEVWGVLTAFINPVLLIL